MKFFVTLLCLILSTVVTGWAQQAPSAKSGDVLAKVGNKEITRDMLDHVISTIPEENRVPFLTPDGKKKILDEVVNFELFFSGRQIRFTGQRAGHQNQTRLRADSVPGERIFQACSSQESSRFRG